MLEPLDADLASLDFQPYTLPAPCLWNECGKAVGDGPINGNMRLVNAGTSPSARVSLENEEPTCLPLCVLALRFGPGGAEVLEWSRT
jgi:hypothetical protein